MDEHPTHPFPYFGLPVTRDVQAISEKIKAKYESEKKWQNSPTEVVRWQQFNKLVVLIADHKGGATGDYVPDLDKIEKIIRRATQGLDGYLLNMVHPNGNFLHPQQLDQLKRETAPKNFNIGADVAAPYLDDLIRKSGIKITEKAPPKALPEPVNDLRAVVLAGKIKLAWNKPRDPV